MRDWKKCASLLLVLSAPALARPPCPAEQARRVEIADQRFQVDTAATQTERERGLAGRERLASDAGLWFVLPNSERSGFWMRGMKFPIDLIWVSRERKVVGATTLPICRSDPCPITHAPAPVSYVLEIEAGRFSGRVGDSVNWSCDETGK